jgi:tRNA(Ile)-lysidine synthase
VSAPLPAPASAGIAPLSQQAFAGLMDRLGPFEANPVLCVAVSGGGDSMALALLADQWVRAKGGRIVALTVDHGLRVEAADEARQVGAWLAARGINHHVLRWEGERPASGVQAAARQARYRLMAEWCREAGVLHLLVAHTLEDQAETFLMRVARGSGTDGLAAMSVASALAQVRLLRPLLGTSRQSLRATLAERGQDWIEDPSNQDEAYERVRVRQALPLLAAVDLTAEALARAALAQAPARAALERETAGLVAQAIQLHPAGFVRIDPEAFLSAPVDIARRVLGRALQTIGGGAYQPRREAVARLHERLVAAGPKGLAATLGGCRLLPKSGKWMLCRETRGLEPAVALQPAKRATWDGRFLVKLEAQVRRSSALTVSALGCDGWTEIIRQEPRLRRRSVLPAAVRPTLPALRDGEGTVAVPHLGFFRDRGRSPNPLALIRFQPVNPLSPASFFFPGEEALLLPADGVLSCKA